MKQPSNNDGGDGDNDVLTVKNHYFPKHLHSAVILLNCISPCRQDSYFIISTIVTGEAELCGWVDLGSICSTINLTGH